jgi:NitT/TauT family transport system permease protein
MRIASGNLAIRFGSVVLFFLVWEAAARLAASRQLPSASAVIVTLANEVAQGGMLHHLGMTLLRVLISFGLAMSVGTLIGFLMGRWRAVDAAFDSWVLLLLNLPALVVTVLAYIWFGLTEVAAIGAVALNKLPLVVVTLREGVRALDRDFADMARAFRLGAWRRMRHIVLPQLSPFLVVAARSGLSLIWKIVLVVELLGRSDGVGFQIQLYFQLFDVARVLAYTIAFVAIIQVIEWTILQPIERHVGRWRR